MGETKHLPNQKFSSWDVKTPLKNRLKTSWAILEDLEILVSLRPGPYIFFLCNFSIIGVLFSRWLTSGGRKAPLVLWWFFTAQWTKIFSIFKLLARAFTKFKDFSFCQNVIKQQSLLLWKGFCWPISWEWLFRV